MSKSFALSYDKWSLTLEQAYVMASAAELHGLISGLLCAGVKAGAEPVLPVLYDFLNDGQALPVAVKPLVIQLIDETAENLSQNDFSFSLLLPCDDDSLTERLEAMVEWVQAFLVGFSVQQTDLSLVSADVREAIEQLTEVTRIDIYTTTDGSADDNEEAYFLVLEHIRLMVMTCFAEVGRRFSGVSAGNKTLH
ncbi:UPF0149 family protein [Chromatiaceae bacterium AAb-1]|nr:UPF0149 family protein [Chromatiaceae bacterium AAb-1]